MLHQIQISQSQQLVIYSHGEDVTIVKESAYHVNPVQEHITIPKASLRRICEEESVNLQRDQTVPWTSSNKPRLDTRKIFCGAECQDLEQIGSQIRYFASVDDLERKWEVEGYSTPQKSNAQYQTLQSPTIGNSTIATKNCLNPDFDDDDSPFLAMSFSQPGEMDASIICLGSQPQGITASDNDDCIEVVNATPSPLEVIDNTMGRMNAPKKIRRFRSVIDLGCEADGESEDMDCQETPVIRRKYRRM